MNAILLNNIDKDLKECKNYISESKKMLSQNNISLENQKKM